MRYLLFFLIFVLVGCETVPTNSESWMERQQNACLPTAIAFREGLKKYQIWSEVVAYNYINETSKKQSGHAIVAYLYPPGSNQLWTYDYMGSWRTRSWTTDPNMIAQVAENLRGRPYNRIKKAEFLK